MVSTLPPQSLLPPFTCISNRGVQRASLCWENEGTFPSSSAVGYDSVSENSHNGFFVECEWRCWREMMHKFCHPGEVSSHQHFGACDRATVTLIFSTSISKVQRDAATTVLHNGDDVFGVNSTQHLVWSQIPFMWFPVFYHPMKLWQVNNLGNSCLQSFSFSPAEGGNSFSVVTGVLVNSFTSTFPDIFIQRSLETHSLHSGDLQFTSCESRSTNWPDFCCMSSVTA